MADLNASVLLNGKSKTSIWSRFYKYRWGYFFILPFLILFACFEIYPLFYNLILSMMKSQGMNNWKFVGLSNFQYLLDDPNFVKSLWNTFYIFIGNVPLMTLFALVIAWILNHPSLKFRRFFQTVYLLPYVTASIVVAIVFQILFDCEFGAVNQLLGLFHIPHLPWLISETWSKGAIIILITWKWLGYNMILMLAGLQAISSEIFESATIDGANKRTTFMKIVLPLMRPTIVSCLVMSTIGTFCQLFDEPYILTGGGPNFSSTPLPMYVYLAAFNYFKFGYASAIAVILGLMVFCMSYFQLKVMDREV